MNQTTREQLQTQLDTIETMPNLSSKQIHDALKLLTQAALEQSPQGETVAYGSPEMAAANADIAANGG